MTVGSALAFLGLPLVVVSLFAGAGSTSSDYDFTPAQMVGVVLGCAAIWLACIAISGWRPKYHVRGGSMVGSVRVLLEQAGTTVSGSTWHELSQTRTIRRLGVVQAVVIVAAGLCVVVFTSAPWYVALVAGLSLSIGLNLAISRYSRSALSRERGRPSR